MTKMDAVKTTEIHQHELPRKKRKSRDGIVRWSTYHDRQKFHEMEVWAISQSCDIPESAIWMTDVCASQWFYILPPS